MILIYSTLFAPGRAAINKAVGHNGPYWQVWAFRTCCEGLPTRACHATGTSWQQRVPPFCGQQWNLTAKRQFLVRQAADHADQYTLHSNAALICNIHTIAVRPYMLVSEQYDQDTTVGVGVAVSAKTEIRPDSQFEVDIT